MKDIYIEKKNFDLLCRQIVVSSRLSQEKLKEEKSTSSLTYSFPIWSSVAHVNYKEKS